MPEDSIDERQDERSLRHLKKPWSGRFRSGTDPFLERFSASIHIDRRLYKYDIRGSIAHARMLAKQGIVSAEDAVKIESGLRKIEMEIEKGEFRLSPELEDIHMNIENRLSELIGDAGGKLHTARSRNDQVALDVRMFMRDELRILSSLLISLMERLAERAEEKINVIMPGYTHLQRAQPVRFSHYLMAHFEALHRDLRRISNLHLMADEMPLGSAALAGTGLPIDRDYVARALDFRSVSRNSIDAVSDRDMIAEFIFICSLVMMHLSRLAEDIIIWSTQEFSFVSLPDHLSTGSSIMPQKKNPDPLELIRGKTGRTYGCLMSVLTLLKGLPMSYNRDLQEDKEPLFNALDTTKDSLKMMEKVIRDITIEEENMRRAAGSYTMATDLTEFLVEKGFSFRKAHEIVGQLVRKCIEENRELDQVSKKELNEIMPGLGLKGKELLDPERCVDRKNHPGATGRRAVLQEIELAKKAIKEFKGSDIFPGRRPSIDQLPLDL